MRTLARAIVLTSMIAGGLPVASARAAGPGDGPGGPQGHEFGLGLMPGIGYRIIVPYQEYKDCGDSSGNASKRVCTNGLPPFLELQASWRLSRAVDLVTGLRVGLVDDEVSDNHQVSVAPGVRVWIDQDTALRLYTTANVVFDWTSYHGVVPSADFGVRNANGLMYDANRRVSVYCQFGETLGLRRWLRFELDLGLGAQVGFR